MYYKKYNTKQLVELAKKIKPIVKNDEGTYKYIKPVDIVKDSFLKKPKFVCGTKKLIPIGEIETLHKQNSKPYFSPTVEDVLSQIDKKYCDKAVAFSIKSILYDLEKSCGGRGYDRAKVTIYRLPDGEELPLKVKNQDVICNGFRYKAFDQEAEDEITI